MTVHLVKMAVGVASLSELAERQRLRLEAAQAAGEPPGLRHVTRSTPRRAGEILDGGSIYWVIRRKIRARQAITAVEAATDDSGKARCALILDAELVPVEPRPRRPFQGWRYLEAAAAPPDARTFAGDAGELPDEMAEELRSLGLL